MALALIGTIGILLMDLFGHNNKIMPGGNEYCMLFKGHFDALPFKAVSFIPFIFVISLGEFLVFVPSKSNTVSLCLTFDKIFYHVRSL